MHTAYTPHQLLKLPLTVESLVSFDDNLLVGTKQGHLLMYSVRSGDQEQASATEDHGGGGLSVEASRARGLDEGPPRVQLLRTNKGFSEKPITHLAAVPEYSILVSLSGGAVRVHDMDMAVTNFPIICTVSRARGATAIAIDLLKQTTLTGETGVAVRMVAAVKRKLQFYYWKNRKFHDLYPDMTVPDVPRSIAWCRDSVCVGFRGEYSLIKVGERQDVCELFPTGKNQEASVTAMSDGERFALGKDDQTTFIDLDGNMKLYAVQWSETPQALAHDAPYLLAVLSRCVEVRTDEPRLNIQTVELARPRFISTPTSSVVANGKGGGRRQGLVYVASQTHIWCLKMVPVSKQVPQLLKDKQFELAVTLSGIGEDSLDSKTKRVHQIQTLYAFDLFCNHRFKESMDVFYQLDTDASHVIGMFADLLPELYKESLSYPDVPPVLQGRELENATLALIEYLTQVRHRLNGATSKTLSPLPIVEGSDTLRNRKQMMQIIDTTLLKCYLRTNPALVAPMLRLKENMCHLEETVKVLRKGRKYAELVIFYNTRGAHEKALTLLKDHSDRADSPVKGHMRTVNYLQNLGPDHLEIICRFSAWVFDVSEKDGLGIFIEDVAEVEALPRAAVLDFLLKARRTVAVPYLRHVVKQWKDTNPVFHNALALQLKEYVVKLTREGKERPEDPEDRLVFKPTVGEARLELMELLRSKESLHDPSLVLNSFPLDSLEEERALLLGRQGFHKEALVLFIYRLRDLPGAMSYCEEFFDGNCGVDGVYSEAFRLLLRPPETPLLKRLNIPTNATPPSGAEGALDMLDASMSKESGSTTTLKVDLMTALDCLPDDVPMSRLGPFLKARMEERVSSRHRQQILRGLMHAEHLQVQEERIALESQRAWMTETTLCRVCHQRFKGRVPVVRRPNGDVLHLPCHEKRKRGLAD